MALGIPVAPPLTITDRFDWETFVNPKPSLVTSGMLEVFEFPDAATRRISSASQLRDGLTISVDPTIDIQFVVTATGGGDNDVQLELTISYLDVGDLTTAAVDETILLTAPVIDTIDRIHTATFVVDKSLIIPGNVTILVLSRLGGDVLDNFGGKIGILKTARVTTK